MKKILLMLITLMFLLSATNVFLASALLDTAIHNFEDYIGSGAYTKSGVDMRIGASKNVTLSEVQELGGSLNRGKSLILYSHSDGDLTQSNKSASSYIGYDIYSIQNKNFVFGFSFLVRDSEAEFNLALRRQDDTSLSQIVTISRNNIKSKYNGANKDIGSYVPSDAQNVNNMAVWNNLRLAVDPVQDIVKIYLNGEYKYECSNIDAESIKYINISIVKGKKANDNTRAGIYFDDFYSYYFDKVETEITDDNASPLNTQFIPYDTDSIIIDFNQDILVSSSASVLLNGYSAEYETIYNNEFATGIKIKNMSLSSSTGYIISFEGITDLMQAPIQDTSFMTTSNEPTVSIATPVCDEYISDEKICFTVTGANIGDSDIDIYQNDNKLKTIKLADNKFYVSMLGGKNKIYADIPDKNIKSNIITINAKSYVNLSPVSMQDFEDGKTTGAGNDLATAEVITSQGNKILHLHCDGITDAPKYIACGNTNNNISSGVYVFEADFKFGEVGAKRNWLTLKYNENSFSYAYVIDNGRIKNYEGTSIYEISADEWYSIKSVYNFTDMTTDFYVNGIRVSKNIPMDMTDFEVFLYQNANLNKIDSTATDMWVDNVRSYHIAYNSDAYFEFSEFPYNSNEVPYNSPSLKIKFSEPVNANAFTSGAILKDNLGNQCKIISAENDPSGKIIKITLDNLKPNMEYTIYLSELKTDDGGIVVIPTLSFKTDKTPFCIYSCLPVENTNTVDISVNIRNMEKEESNIILIAALYSENMLLGSDSCTDINTDDDTYVLNITKPNEEYTIEIYMFKNDGSLTVIDSMILQEK